MPRLRAEDDLRQLVLLAAATGHLSKQESVNLHRSLLKESQPAEEPVRAAKLSDISALGIKVVDRRR